MDTKEICGIEIGNHNYVAALNVDNNERLEFPNVIFVTQDITSNGMVESLRYFQTSISGISSGAFGNPWETSTVGKHTIEAFIWQLNNETGMPFPLIDSSMSVIEVFEYC